MTFTNRKTQAGWNLENTYKQLSESFYSTIDPNPVADPELVLLNEPLAKELGLDPASLSEDVLGGNEMPEGAASIAQAYAGHQFGHLTMLGDGRALMIGEQITPAGKRVDVQLKGSGRTPYSRGGDGRATLGPMLREYIMSEAMHHLGIPTSRSLAVVTTGEQVRRETEWPGAILTRVASSHLRVGTFQYARQLGEEAVKQLADYAIDRHFPEVNESNDRYITFFEKVVERQAELIAKWQLTGFIHGVMNTDNMTISGETIDYGPCAFMDTYDPKTVFSSIDTQGRYSYGNQPGIGEWNLARLAEALLPLFADDQEEAVKKAEHSLSKFAKEYKKHWLSGMRSKLGLFGEEAQDEPIIEDLLGIMEKHEADFTNTFRQLTLGNKTEMDGRVDFDQWRKQWEIRLERQQQSEQEIEKLMRRSNPSIIPRNHRVEEALEAAVSKEDMKGVRELLAVLADPYAYTPEQEPYTKLPEPTGTPYRTFCGT
ncbi:YdiU family protein [Halobacillus fulvus]|nr:YdiU family protein [Halobacillus fulvus]